MKRREEHRVASRIFAKILLTAFADALVVFFRVCAHDVVALVSLALLLDLARLIVVSTGIGNEQREQRISQG